MQVEKKRLDLRTSTILRLPSPETWPQRSAGWGRCPWPLGGESDGQSFPQPRRPGSESWGPDKTTVQVTMGPKADTACSIHINMTYSKTKESKTYSKTKESKTYSKTKESKTKACDNVNNIIHNHSYKTNEHHYSEDDKWLFKLCSKIQQKKLAPMTKTDKAQKNTLPTTVKWTYQQQYTANESNSSNTIYKHMGLNC